MKSRVFKYLVAHYGENVIFEPDGKVPPDFLVNSKFEVEVRRLNKSFSDKGSHEGLEQVTIPIFEVCNEVLRSFDARYQGNSYWVSLQFERPLSTSMRQVKKEMEITLETFITSVTTALPCTLFVNPNIRFTIDASDPITGRVFRPAGGTDRNANGWVIPDYQDNLRHCIIEKSAKVSDYLTKYHEWWLYLLDHMGWGLDEKETEKSGFLN